MNKTGGKKRKNHDEFFMQMAASCGPDESGVKEFEQKNEELLASWLEYNASHGEKMRKKSMSPKKKQ